MASRFYTRNKAEYSKHITIIATISKCSHPDTKYEANVKRKARL